MTNLGNIFPWNNSMENENLNCSVNYIFISAFFKETLCFFQFDVNISSAFFWFVGLKGCTFDELESWMHAMIKLWICAQLNTKLDLIYKYAGSSHIDKAPTSLQNKNLAGSGSFPYNNFKNMEYNLAPTHLWPEKRTPQNLEIIGWRDRVPPIQKIVFSSFLVYFSNYCMKGPAIISTCNFAECIFLVPK